MDLKTLIKQLNDALIDASLDDLEHIIVERQFNCI